MKRITNISEIIGTMDMPKGECEVCISADANYDQSSRQLLVELESFLRTTDIRTAEKHIFADWLPKPKTVTESVSPEEALEAARDIFHHWIHKVRQAAPSLRRSTT